MVGTLPPSLFQLRRTLCPPYAPCSWREPLTRNSLPQISTSPRKGGARRGDFKRFAIGGSPSAVRSRPPKRLVAGTVVDFTMRNGDTEIRRRVAPREIPKDSNLHARFLRRSRHR